MFSTFHKQFISSSAKAFNFEKFKIILWWGVENYSRKRSKYWLSPFSQFPTMFSKAFLPPVSLKLCSRWSNLNHTILILTILRKKLLEDIEGKEKMLVTSIFSFSHHVFLLYCRQKSTF